MSTCGSKGVWRESGKHFGAPKLAFWSKLGALCDPAELMTEGGSKISHQAGHWNSGVAGPSGTQGYDSECHPESVWTEDVMMLMQPLWSCSAHATFAGTQSGCALSEHLMLFFSFSSWKAEKMGCGEWSEEEDSYLHWVSKKWCKKSHSTRRCLHLCNLLHAPCGHMDWL